MNQNLVPTKHQVNQTFKLPDVPDSVVVLGYSPNDNEQVPSTDNDYVLRRSLLREVTAFLTQPFADAFYISGPTGSGKTSGITEILGRLNWPCQQVTAHGRLELADLIGHYKLVSTSKGEAPTMKFCYGVLPIAMKYGHVLLINEIDFADPAEISGLNDIIEGRPLVITETGGEVIQPHPMFRLIATGNSFGSGDESGMYQGVMVQNIAFMDRFRVTKVSYMEELAERVVLEKKVPRLPEVVRVKMIEVANAIRAQFLGESDQGIGTLATTMSTRTLCRWAGLTWSNRQNPSPLEYALDLALTNRVNESERIAIHKIATGIFGDQWTSI